MRGYTLMPSAMLSHTRERDNSLGGRVVLVKVGFALEVECWLLRSLMLATDGADGPSDELPPVERHGPAVVEVEAFCTLSATCGWASDRNQLTERPEAEPLLIRRSQR